MRPEHLRKCIKSAIARADASSRIFRARRAVDADPSEKQKNYGNYAKGHVHLHGLDISIENPKGSIRRGVSKSGTEWACKMFCDYGYLKRTTGADAEPVDCFIGEHPHSELVFCIDQMVNGKFDELKVMLGFLNAEDAKAGYLANYAPGWNGCGHVTPLTMEQFKSWLEHGDETKPMEGQRFETFHKKASTVTPKIAPNGLDATMLNSKPHPLAPPIKVDINPAQAKAPAYGEHFQSQLQQAQQYNNANKLPDTTQGWNTPVRVDVRNNQPADASRNADGRQLIRLPSNTAKFLETPGGVPNLTPEQQSKVDQAEILRHELRHAGGENWQTEVHDHHTFIGTPTDPGYANRANFMAKVPHDLAPPEMRNYMSSLQEHMFQTTGKRITTPQEYDQAMQNWKVDHPDNNQFEQSIKAVPMDAQRMLRAMRDKSIHPEYMNTVKDWQRRVMPGIVSVNNNEQTKQADAGRDALAPKPTPMPTVKHADGEHYVCKGRHNTCPSCEERCPCCEKHHNHTEDVCAKCHAAGPQDLHAPPMKKADSERRENKLLRHKHEAKDLATCPECAHLFVHTKEPETSVGAVACPKCGSSVTQEHCGEKNGAALSVNKNEVVAPNAVPPMGLNTNAMHSMALSPHPTVFKDTRPVFTHGVQVQPSVPALPTAPQTPAVPVPPMIAKSAGLINGLRLGVDAAEFMMLANATKKKKEGEDADAEEINPEAEEHDMATNIADTIKQNPNVSMIDPHKKPSIIPLLQTAKAHSDAGRYDDKAAVMRSLFTTHGNEFEVDQDDGGTIVGVNHKPSNFKMHLPRNSVPPSLMNKSASKDKFSKPENPETFEKGKNWTLYAGGNDWENGITTCWVDTPDYHDGKERVWFDVDFSKFPNHDKSPSPSSEDGKAENEWGNKAARAWLAAARSIKAAREDRASDSGNAWHDYFTEALQTPEMQPYVKSHGTERTKWQKVAATVQTEATGKALSPQDALTDKDIGYGEHAGKALNLARQYRAQNPHIQFINSLEDRELNQKVPINISRQADPEMPGNPGEYFRAQNRIVLYPPALENNGSAIPNILGHELVHSTQFKPTATQQALNTPSLSDEYLARQVNSYSPVNAPNFGQLYQQAPQGSPLQTALQEHEIMAKLPMMKREAVRTWPSILDGSSDEQAHAVLYGWGIKHPDSVTGRSDVILPNVTPEAYGDVGFFKEQYDKAPPEMRKSIYEKLLQLIPGVAGHVTDNEVEKQAATAEAPRTGPEAIMHALSQIDMTHLETLAKDDIKSGKVTRRGKAVKTLNIIEGLRRNKLEPHHLMISKVPVLPPIFRPFSVAGGSFVPGDANELYKDLFTARDLYRDHQKEFGAAGAGEARLNLYNAVKACYGYGEPVNAKTKMRGVSGFLAKIVGSSPKHGWMLSKMISKPMDSVSRGVIIPNPDLGLDEIGIPEDHAWSAYAPHIQRKLVLSGQSPLDAIKSIKERDGQARRALELITTPGPHGRPVIYSRAPAWHKFSVVAAWPKIIPGHVIQINPYCGSGLNADHDGNCIKVGTKIMLAMPRNYTQGGDPMNHQKTKIRVNKNETSAVCISIEDCPRLEHTIRKDKNGADIFDVPPGIKVLSPVPGKGMQWCDVESLTRERDMDCVTMLCASGHSVDISTNESVAVFDPATNGLVKVTPADAIGHAVPVSRCAALITEPVNVSADNYEFGWLLGAFLSDGWIDENDMIGYTKLNVEHRRRFVNALSLYLGDAESQLLKTKNYCETHIAENNSGIGGDSAKIHIRVAQKAETPRLAWLLTVLRDCYSPELSLRKDTGERACLYKQLPELTWSLPIEALYGLLAGLIDGDGCVSVSYKPERPKPVFLCNLSTSSPYLRDSVMALAQFLGIRTSCSVTQPNAKRVQTHDSYTVGFSVVDIRRLGLHLKLTKQTSADALRTLLTAHEMKDNFDSIPITKEELRELHNNRALACRETVATKLTAAKKIGYALVSRVWVQQLPADELQKLPNLLQRAQTTSVTWTTVKSAVPCGKHDVYDLAVPETKVFAIANGLVVFDTLNVHVPATDDAVQEAKDKLMPTKMLFTIRNPDKIMPVIKHETILGLHSAAMAPAKQRHIFPSHAEALSAIKRGQIALSDEIDIAQPPEPLDAVKNACVSHMVLDYLLATAVHAASNSEEETDEMCKQASRWSQLLAAGKLSAGSIQRLLQPLGKLYTRPRQAIDPQVIAGEGTKFQQLIGIRNALKLPVHPPSLGVGPYFSGGADMANDAALLESRGMDFNKALGFLRNFPEMPGLKKVTDALKFHEQPIPTPKWNAPANLDPQAIYRGHGLPDVQVIERKHVGVLHGTPEPSTAAIYATAPAFGDPRLNVLPDHMGFLSTYKVSPTQVYQPNWTLNKGKAGHPIEHFRQPRTTPVTPDDMYETDVTHNALLNTQIVRARPSASPLFSTADIPQTPQWLKILQNIKRASESESLIPA